MRSRFITYLVPVMGLNTLISLVISLSIFRGSVSTDGAGAFVMDLVPFVAHYFMLNLALGLVVWLLGFILRGRKHMALSALLFTALQGFLVIDLQIYGIYKYHINGLVLNLIMTEGAGDSVLLGAGTVMSFIGIMSVIVLMEVAAHFFVAPRLQRLEGRPHLMFRRTAAALFAIGLLLIAVDKGMYAWADITNDIEVTNNAKLYPLYQPLTMKKFARKTLGIRIDRDESLDLSRESSLLEYPRRPLTFDDAQARGYNYLLIVLEGARFDMLDPDIMPRTWEFGQRSLVFKSHYSGGNATRFGIFSLMYGLNGTYWHNFLATRTPPVIMDTLIDRGYDFYIISATKLTYPEFRSTVFQRVPDFITDDWSTKDYIKRDRVIAQKVSDYFNTREQGKPFFTYVSLNASHQMYKYPDEFEKFTPVAPRDINYFKDATKDKAPLLLNRYMNSLYYDDHLIGQMLDALEAAGYLDNTVVVITGDHGEEFFEQGYLGHTSSFDDYQTRVPFVMHVPGEEPRGIERLTSHADLVPTVMEWLGTTSPPEDYSQGVSLMKETDRTFVVSTGWDDMGVIFEDHTVTLSTETYNIGRLDVRRKQDYSPIEDRREFIRDNRELFLGLARDMSAFYKK